jgi:hypothetical protein
VVGGHLRQLVDAFKHLGCITQAKGKTAARGGGVVRVMDRDGIGPVRLRRRGESYDLRGRLWRRRVVQRDQFRAQTLLVSNLAHSATVYFYTTTHSDRLGIHGGVELLPCCRQLHSTACSL